MTFKNTLVSSDDSTINFGSMGTELKVAISICVVQCVVFCIVFTYVRRKMRVNSDQDRKATQEKIAASLAEIGELNRKSIEAKINSQKFRSSELKTESVDGERHTWNATTEDVRGFTQRTLLTHEDDIIAGDGAPKN